MATEKPGANGFEIRRDGEPFFRATVPRVLELLRPNP